MSTDAQGATRRKNWPTSSFPEVRIPVTLRARALGRLDHHLADPPEDPSLDAIVEKIAPLGWHVVIYFEADQRYTRVVHQGGDALIRTPLRELLAQFDPEQFWQIHRSVLVNSRCIAKAIRVDEGSMVVTLRGRDERLPVSRQFQALFKGQ